MCKQAASFAEEIEQLNETISLLSSQINELLSEKNYHGQKFIEILEKAKIKNQITKTENKRLSKKYGKLQNEFDKLTDKLSQLTNDRDNDVKERKKLNEYVEKLESESKQLRRKLFKVESDNDVIHLDPYELHRKIRYYESQIDFNDKEYLKIRKQYNEIMNYLNLLGITKEDLKISWATGILQFQNFNSKWFDLNYRRDGSPKKRLYKPRKSITYTKDDELIKERLNEEKYEQARKLLNSSKTKNYDISFYDELDSDTLSISSETKKSNNDQSIVITFNFFL